MNFKEALCTQLPNTRESIYTSVWHLGHVSCKKKKKKGKQILKCSARYIRSYIPCYCVRLWVCFFFVGMIKCFYIFICRKNAAWQPEIPIHSFGLSVTAIQTRNLEEEEKKNIFENTFHLAKLRLLFVLSGSHGHVRILFSEHCSNYLHEDL